MKLKIVIDSCIGCGTCAAIAPKTFQMNDAYKAEILDENGDDAETIKSAVDACAVQAIKIEE